MTTNKFTKKNYNNPNGMLTSVWGPPLWHFLHVMSFNYPVHPTLEEKQQYRNFIYSLTHIMPCKKCRDNLKYNLKCKPIGPFLKNRSTFSKYIYALHETINKYLNKKSGLSYCNVRDRYEHFRANCGKKQKNNTHIGCSNTSNTKKTKSVINIVPSSYKCKTLKIDKRCYKSKNNNKKK